MDFLSVLVSVVLLFSYVQCDDAVHIPNAAEYERLMDDLWKESSVARRNTPPFNANGSVSLAFGLNLISVGFVSTTSGVVELLFWDHYAWTDERLSWDPTEYGGATQLRIPSTMIWMPDLRTYNSLMAREEDVKSNVYAVVKSNGDVLYIPPNSRKVRCTIRDNADTASCSVTVGSWTYDGNMLDLDFYAGLKQMDISSFTPGGSVTGVSNNQAIRHVKIYDCCPDETYIDLGFSFDLNLASATENENEGNVVGADDGKLTHS